CSPSEKSLIPPEHNNRAIVILLTICPRALQPYTYSSPNSDVETTDVPTTNPPSADKIGLNSKTGDLDLRSLVVPAGSGHDHPSRHLDITYALQSPCPSDKQYSFYFQNKPPPFERKTGDQSIIQLKPHPLDDGATSVLLSYKNDGNEKVFQFRINYTFVKTDSGGVGTPQDGMVDPNIKNTPVQ
ncbi:MAG: hypothetical protein ACXWLQ_07565, partial [Rhizomicrobium sp.]